MNSEKRRRLEEVFLEAAELPATRRQAFCEAACEGDAELLTELARLLRGHDRAEEVGFLEDAAWRLKSSRAQLPPEDEMIGKTIDRYEIQRKIGEQAGMGDVYLAVEKMGGEVIRSVVIKFAQARLEASERKRFDDEVRILARLEQHNNIARMYACGFYEENPYFVMEHLDGVSLSQFLREEGKGGGLPLDVIEKILAQACAGLQFAHDRGVVHRDIKPQNLMIVRASGELQVKVIDFGIAKASFGATRQATVGVVGTAQYLAPEQLSPERFGEPDHRVDIHAMGLVLHEMLTGRTAVRGATVAELIQKHLNETPPLPVADAGINGAVMKALRKAPGERQARISDLAAEYATALKAFFEKTERIDVPASPSPTPVPRPRWPWALAAALALAVLAGGAKFYFDSGGVAPTPAASPAVVNTTVAPTPAPAMVEKPRLALFRMIGENQYAPVETNATFRGGDRVRFEAVAPFDGYLYLIQMGSSGRFTVMLPHKRIESGRHFVKRGEAYAFPPRGAFELDRAPGVETIYVYAAREKSEPLAAAIERSIAAFRGGGNALPTLDSETVRELLSSGAVLAQKLSHEK